MKVTNYFITFHFRNNMGKLSIANIEFYVNLLCKIIVLVIIVSTINNIVTIIILINIMSQLCYYYLT